MPRVWLLSGKRMAEAGIAKGLLSLLAYTSGTHHEQLAHTVGRTVSDARKTLVTSILLTPQVRTYY